MTLTRRRTLGLMGAAAGVALALPALAQGEPLQVGVLRLASHAPTFIALERGLFAEAGLDVELVYFDAAQPMAVAIAAGDVDYGMTAISGGLINLAEKGAIKVFGGALAETPDVPGQVILVSDAAFKDGVTSPAMLDGRRFAMTTAGSSFHYMGSRIAEAEGVEMEFVPLQTVGAVIGALRTGQVDAWSIVPNIAAGLVASGEMHEIGRVADYLPGYQVTTIFGATEMVADRETTEAFLGVMREAIAAHNATMIAREGGDEAAAEMARVVGGYVYPDRTAEEAAEAILSGAMMINEGAALDMGSVRDQLEWFQSEGLIDGSITVESFVDTSYVETTG